MAAAPKRANKKADRPEDTAMRKLVPTEVEAPRADGLWVNTEFFRSLRTRPPRTIVQNSPRHEENYYLKLADIILAPAEKRKADHNAAFRESARNLKTPKTG